tara:strand:+ start:4404 stop:5285 length:882 start_codon:yes stop_codon:yes gene_type:complete
MGTKGKKNIPITARVESGLFNQKKGVKEPLLNVGPAGVHGDNQTRDIPSPSKLRGYSMKKKTESPIKQKVGVLESESTGDKIVKGKKITRNKTFADLEAEGITVTDEMRQWAKDNPNVPRDQVDTGQSEPDEVIPGDKKEKFTATQTRDKMDAMSPWRVRQQSRSIKKSGKDVRQSQNKLDATNRKLKKLSDAGITSGRKFDRLTAKQTENTNELDAFNKNMTARTRQVEMSKDPLKTGTFDSASRDMELYDASTTYEGQKEIIKAGGVKGAGKKSSPNFFKSKSPMKKNYFN